MQFIYSTVSTIATGFGFLFIGLLTMSQLQQPSNFNQRIQNLALKWTTFIGFICIQPILVQLFYIIPFGNLLILLVKIILIVPENRISGWINERVRRIGKRIISKESSFSGVMKEIAVFSSVLLMTVSRYIIEYTDIQNTKTVKNSIKKCYKLIQKKQEQQEKREEKSSFSQSEKQQNKKKEEIIKNQLILVPRIKAYQLNVDGKKFERSKQIQIQFSSQTNTIRIYKDQGTKQRKLKQIKYISNDLLELQLIVYKPNGQGYNSYPIQLIQEWQIQKWMKPIIKSLSNYRNNN